MRYTLLIAFTGIPFVASLVVLNTRQADTPVWKCGNEGLSEDPSMSDARVQFLTNAATEPHSEAITVQTYLHVVSSERNRNLITDAVVNEQFRVLNDRFRLAGIQFRLVSTTRNISNAWADTTVRFPLPICGLGL